MARSGSCGTSGKLRIPRSMGIGVSVIVSPQSTRLTEGWPDSVPHKVFLGLVVSSL